MSVILAMALVDERTEILTLAPPTVQPVFIHPPGFSLAVPSLPQPPCHSPQAGSYCSAECIEL